MNPGQPNPRTAEGRFYQDVGRSLRRARKRTGLTQTAAAEVMGLSRSSYANVERGKQRLLLWPFRKLCVRLGVRPETAMAAWARIGAQWP